MSEYLGYYVDERGRRVSKEVDNQVYTVVDSKVVLDEIPIERYRLNIKYYTTMLSEVELNENITKPTEYKVDYIYCIVYFDKSMEGKDVTISLMSAGRTLNGYSAMAIEKSTKVMKITGGTFEGEVRGITAPLVDNSKLFATTEFVKGQHYVTQQHTHDDYVKKVTILDSGADLNSVNISGFYHLNSSMRNVPSNVDYGQLIVCRGGDAIFQQITSCTNSEVYTRQGNVASDTWQPWRRLWHDGNFTPPTKLSQLTNDVGYITAGGTTTGSVDGGEF